MLRTLAALLLALVASITCSAATTHVPSDFPTIQEAVNVSADGDTVLVACGTSYEYDINMKSGVYLRSETGDADCVTIDADSQGTVLRCGIVNNLTTVEGFTITGGLAEAAGGGISCCAGCEATLKNLTVSGNRGELGGGGLDISLSSPIILGCSFLSNRSDLGVGGGMHISGSSSAPRLEGCTFRLNHAPVDGGGLHIETGASPEMSDCIFDTNDAERGGGVFMWNEATATFTRCTFSDNVAGIGGGLMTVDCSATLTDCEFAGNSSTDRGGAAALQNSTLTAEGCDLIENSSAAFAGGLQADSGATVELAGCLFERNHSTYQGGAIRVHNSSQLTMTGCTLVENGSLTGGGLAVDDSAPITIGNTIIAFGAEGPAVMCMGALPPQMSCCDIFGNAGGDWAGCVAGLLGIDGNIEQDPLFCGPLSPDPYTLHSNSPCAAEAEPSCGPIGARDVDCGSTPVEDTTWGAVKAQYR